MTSEKRNRRRTMGRVGMALGLSVCIMPVIIPAAAQKPPAKKPAAQGKGNPKPVQTGNQKPTAQKTTAPTPAVTLPPPTAPDGSKMTSFVETLPKSVVKVQMVPIPGGTLKIGGKEVVIKPFYMAKTETPWEAFDAFVASGPPSPPYDQTEFPPDAVARPSKSYILPDLGWGHNSYPAINISFDSATMYCRWLAAETKKKYRLPTEAEWEWAARAGVVGAWKMDKATMEKTVWYLGNSDKLTNPVGKKQPNPFGLQDILGNPGEWAIDMKGEPVLCGGTFLDPAAKITPTERKYKDASWQATDPQFPKSRWWLADGKFVGFRVICEP